jgi:hypothetical protein
MKNRLLLLLVVLGMCLTSTAWAGYHHSRETMAPDRVGHWDLGIGVAAALNDSANDTAFFYGQASYGVTPYIGLGIESGWEEADSDTNDDTFGVVPVLADIILRIPTVHESLVPYGILGLGAANVYTSGDNSDDVDDIGFTWKLGAGADWFMDANWIFNFEFAYWNADVNLPGTSAEDGFNWWTFGVALKYVF